MVAELQSCIEYKAREKGLEVVEVSPKDVLEVPKCGGKLAENGRRVLECKRCGFVGDRDVIATTNL
jgi:putative transposase